ncbi:MAG: LrgB family protein [Solobacterium sp.]|nr:LrgB family protein [Solobacterium sp.]
MNNPFAASATAGAVLSLLAYFLGMYLKRKTGWGFMNPLLIAIVLVIVVLLCARIDYDTYNASAKYISWFLTPATVSLAVPLYQQLDRLKQNIKAILVSILAGCIASMGSVFALSLLFGFTHEQYVTFLPKSITTAIGMGVAQELGGITAITVAVIIVTGIFGNIIGEALCKALKITDPIATGLALGTSAHAIGTARAMELGETQGAMSSLAIVTSGIITVIFANFFAMLI